MGNAYLPDGTVMDYNEYIQSSPRWKAVRAARLNFDDGKCVVCHADVRDNYETHHLSYSRLGSEHLRDVLTLCPSCHAVFHNNWGKTTFWKGRENNHWEAFNIEQTAQICHRFWREDKYISGNWSALNMCNKEICRQLIDQWCDETCVSDQVSVDPNDIALFVRNKRLEMWFRAEEEGKTTEEFLDEQFGPKVRGKNPIRQEAGKKGGAFDYTPAKAKRLYSENKNLLRLMEAVREMEANNNEKTQ